MAPDRLDGELTDLVRNFLQDRDTEALGEIFRHCYPRMRAMASRVLKRTQIPEVDYEPEDALISTLDTMMRLVLTGRVESIEGVDGFWRLYRKILAWKIAAASDRHAALKRGGIGTRKRFAKGQSPSGEPAVLPRTLIPADDFDLFQSNLLPADVLAISKEVTERLIELLQPDLQSIVRMRLEGSTIAQMATVLGVSPRTINRMLESIRGIWASSGLLNGAVPPDGVRDRRP